MGLHGELVDDAVAGVLGISRGEATVDLWEGGRYGRCRGAWMRGSWRASVVCNRLSATRYTVSRTRHEMNRVSSSLTRAKCSPMQARIPEPKG
jgi:hypothetical protein